MTYWTTTGTATSWSSASNVANITFAATSTTSTSITVSPVAVLPLREPFLDASPGWLSPEGKYYPVNYIRMQRHDQIAVAIMADLLGLDPGYTNDQNYLMSIGWLRVDDDGILPKNSKSTREQRDALRELVQLNGDEQWNKVKDMIKSYTFIQRKNNKAKDR